MHTLAQMYRAAARRLARAHSSLAATPDRGDVPGWVLIAVMTAAIVTALMAVAVPLLTGLFRETINAF